MFEDIDAQDIAQSIRQEREDFSGSFLLIEGKGDHKTLIDFVNKDLCSVEVAGDRKTAIEVLRILEEDGFSGVLCIVDTDYTYSSFSISKEISNENYKSENIIETNVHDLDMLIFLSPAFDKFLRERCNQSLLDGLRDSTGSEFRDLVLKAAKKIGCLRLLNYNLNKTISLDFRDLTYSFLDKSTLSVDCNLLFEEVFSKSKRKSIDKNDLKSRYDTVLKQEHDLAKICQGHDVTNIIAIALRGVVANIVRPNTISIDPRSWRSEVEMNLRLSFGWEHFVHTSLYSNIREWEQNNSPYVVLITV